MPRYYNILQIIALAEGGMYEAKLMLNMKRERVQRQDEHDRRWRNVSHGMTQLYNQDQLPWTCQDYLQVMAYYGHHPVQPLGLSDAQRGQVMRPDQFMAACGGLDTRDDYPAKGEPDAPVMCEGCRTKSAGFRCTWCGEWYCSQRCFNEDMPVHQDMCDVAVENMHFGMPPTHNRELWFARRYAKVYGIGSHAADSSSSATKKPAVSSSSSSRIDVYASDQQQKRASSSSSAASNAVVAGRSSGSDATTTAGSSSRSDVHSSKDQQQKTATQAVKGVAADDAALAVRGQAGAQRGYRTMIEWRYAQRKRRKQARALAAAAAAGRGEVAAAAAAAGRGEVAASASGGDEAAAVAAAGGRQVAAASRGEVAGADQDAQQHTRWLMSSSAANNAVATDRSSGSHVSATAGSSSRSDVCASPDQQQKRATQSVTDVGAGFAAAAVGGQPGAQQGYSTRTEWRNAQRERQKQARALAAAAAAARRDEVAAAAAAAGGREVAASPAGRDEVAWADQDARQQKMWLMSSTMSVLLSCWVFDIFCFMLRLVLQ